MATQLLRNINNPEFAAVLKEVFKRAMTNPEYRQQALDDAAGAIDQVGGNIAGWNLKFIEAQEGVDDVVQLPPAIEAAPELSEEELEAIAGGLEELENEGGCCTNTCVLTGGDA